MDLPADLVDDPFFMVIARLSDCLCEELAAAKGPALCYCGMWVGNAPPPLGPNACDGIAWVRLVGAYPSTVFPVPDEGSQSTQCATPMAYEVEIGVARPAPRAADRAIMPDKQDLFNAQRLYMSDMRAAQRALLCCLPKAHLVGGGRALRVVSGGWTPLENAMSRSGGTLQGFIGLA